MLAPNADPPKTGFDPNAADCPKADCCTAPPSGLPGEPTPPNIDVFPCVGLPKTLFAGFCGVVSKTLLPPPKPAVDPPNGVDICGLPPKADAPLLPNSEACETAGVAAPAAAAFPKIDGA